MVFSSRGSDVILETNRHTLTDSIIKNTLLKNTLPIDNSQEITLHNIIGRTIGYKFIKHNKQIQNSIVDAKQALPFAFCDIHQHLF